jgi:hypothetical protein
MSNGRRRNRRSLRVESDTVDGGEVVEGKKKVKLTL